jgi:23S rRNA (pseudouridine1915-N3)-methyltransferase
MNLRFVKLGKIHKDEVKSLTAEYQKRLSSWGKLEIFETKDPGQDKPSEILKLCQHGSNNFIILLDERGTQFNSVQLSSFLLKKIEDPLIKQITFLVGGPFGVGSKVRDSVNFIWSLSDLVFPNELAWLLLWEQLYRSWSIINNNGYHHE